MRGVVHQRGRRVRRLGRQHARQSIANEILGKKHGRQTRERGRLVIAKPQDFRKGESLERGIAGEVSKSALAADALGDLATFGGRSAVAPQERWSNHLTVRVEKHRRVHLSRNADRRDRHSRSSREHRPNRRDARLPPRLRILLGPTRLRRR